MTRSPSGWFDKLANATVPRRPTTWTGQPTIRDTLMGVGVIGWNELQNSLPENRTRRRKSRIDVFPPISDK